MIPIEPLNVVCAWCGDELQRGTPGARTSHGLCSRCADEVWRGHKGMPAVIEGGLPTPPPSTSPAVGS